MKKLKSKSEQNVIFFEDTGLEESTHKILKDLPNFPSEKYSDLNQIPSLKKKINFKDINSWVGLKNLIFEKLKVNSFVIIKKIPFYNDNNFLMGISFLLGSPLLHGFGRDRMILDIKPKSGDKDFEAYPHTDSANWPVPHDLTMLYCIKKDQNNKAGSFLCKIDDVLKQMEKDQLEGILEKISSGQFLFYLDPSFDKKGYQKKPILTFKNIKGKEFAQIRFARPYMTEVIKKYKLHVSPETLETTSLFEDMVRKSHNTNFVLEEGDLLLFHNNRILHWRDSPSENSIRFLKKMKINVNQENIY